jgi:hypothetical protein
MSESSDSESPVKAPPPRPKQQPSPAKADAQQPALKPPKQQQQPAPTKSASETVEAAAAAGSKLSKEARDALVQKLIQANAHPPPPSHLARAHRCAGQAQARGSCCAPLAAARRK